MDQSPKPGAAGDGVDYLFNYLTPTTREIVQHQQRQVLARQIAMIAARKEQRELFDNNPDLGSW